MLSQTKDGGTVVTNICTTRTLDQIVTREGGTLVKAAVGQSSVLDKMAENGLRLNRFYAGAPVCSPTRASVLTGRANDRKGRPGGLALFAEKLGVNLKIMRWQLLYSQVNYAFFIFGRYMPTFFLYSLYSSPNTFSRFFSSQKVSTIKTIINSNNKYNKNIKKNIKKKY